MAPFRTVKTAETSRLVSQRTAKGEFALPFS